MIFIPSALGGGEIFFLPLSKPPLKGSNHIIIILFVFTLRQGIYNYITKTNHFLGYCSVAVVQYLVCATNSHVEYVLYFLNVCSGQYGCFYQFLGFMLSWYVAQSQIMMSSLLLEMVLSVCTC